jgi:hypothetical protein
MSSINTFPPLISGSSFDSVGGKQLSGNSIISSLRIEESPADQFFNPQVGFSGYACNGMLYQNGVPVQGAAPASWFSEPVSTYRGGEKEFPTSALVLLTDAGLSIIDISGNMNMWMIFLRGDTFAFFHNFNLSQSGFIPVGLAYSQGAIIINLSSDPGSTIKGNAALILDFVNDTVRMDMSLQNPLDNPTPDPNTGFLSSEATWIKGQISPAARTFGTITRIPDVALQDCIAHGQWSVKGYTPVNSAQPAINETLYGITFQGPVYGTADYVDFTNLQDYQVSLYEFGGNQLNLMGTSSINQYGGWGPVEASGSGRKYVTITQISTGLLLGDSWSPCAYDSMHNVCHYMVENGSPVFSHSNPSLSNGTWVNTKESNLNPNQGQWISRLVRMSDGVIMAEAGTGYGLLRSWKYGSDDVSNICYMEHHALAVLAFALDTTDTDFITSILCGLLNTQNSDGSWPAVVAQDTGKQVYPGYVDNGVVALCVYALLLTLNPSSVFYSTAVQAIKKGLAYLTGGIVNTNNADPRLGLISQGNGLMVSSGIYSNVSRPKVQVNTNLWAFFAFAMASGVFQGMGYDQVAKNISKQLYGLWQTQGFDPSIAGATATEVLYGDNLETIVLLSIWFLTLGDTTNLFTSLLATNAYSYGSLTSFKGFSKHLAVPGVCVSSTMMLDLLSALNRNQTQWGNVTLGALGFRGNDFGWSNEFEFGVDSAVLDYESVKGTAWVILSQNTGFQNLLFTGSITSAPMTH